MYHEEMVVDCQVKLTHWVSFKCKSIMVTLISSAASGYKMGTPAVK